MSVDRENMTPAKYFGFPKIDVKNKNLMRHIILRCSRSLIDLAHLFYFDYLTEHGRYIKPAKIHPEVSDLLIGSIREKYNLLMILPRGTAKTTYSTLFFITWLLLFGDKRYILLIGEQSVFMHFSTLKDEIENNSLLHFFGVNKKDGGTWNAGAIDVETIDPTDNNKKRVVRIEAYTMNTFPRGAKRKNMRPDLVIIDDLERRRKGTMLGVEDEKYRGIVRDFFFSVLLPSSFNMESMQIVMLGTIMHEEQLLNKLYKLAIDGNSTPPFKAIKYALIENYGTPNAYSIWEDKISLEKFEKMVETAKKTGTLKSIYNEYLSKDFDEEEDIFTEDKLRYFFKRANEFIVCDNSGKPTNDITVNIAELKFFITVDLAFSYSVNSDDTAICVSAIDRKERVFLIEIENGKFTPREIVKKIVELVQKYNIDTIGIEKVNGTEPIIDMLENELYKYKINTEIKLLQHNNISKHTRIIASLQPLVEEKRIFLNVNMHNLSKFKNQLFAIKRSKIASKHDDLVDAFSYITNFIEYIPVSHNQFDTNLNFFEKNLDNIAKNSYIF